MKISAEIPDARDQQRLQEWLADQNVLGTVEELAHLAPPERAVVFGLLPDERAQEVFLQLDAAHQRELLAAIPDGRMRKIVEAMEPDDRARLLDELPSGAARQVMARLSPREQEMTSLLLGYEDESAGRIMSPEFIALRASMTVQEALASVRAHGQEAETIYVLPVTDDDGRVTGLCELGDLVLASPVRRVEDIMDRDVHVVHVDDDQEKVARLIQSADVLAIPVVDDAERLVGLVTIDDAMDVLEFEQSEDLARVGAAAPLGRPYFSASVFSLARSRVLWLTILAVAAILTVNVLSAFEAILEEVVSLALFIPLLIGTGGNAGAQSATTIVRAMALDDIRFEDLFRVVFREMRAGFLLGTMLGVLGFVPVWLYVGGKLAVVVSSTLVSVCTLATLVGSVMPILARRLGFDPAVVSAPFVTTLVDATGLLVYFLIAGAVLGL